MFNSDEPRFARHMHASSDSIEVPIDSFTLMSMFAIISP